MRAPSFSVQNYCTKKVLIQNMKLKNKKINCSVAEYTFKNLKFVKEIFLLLVLDSKFELSVQLKNFGQVLLKMYNKKKRFHMIQFYIKKRN